MTETPIRDDFPHTIPVEIKNWSDSAPPPKIQRTVLHTYILDPASPAGTFRNVQICEYEPNRFRTIIQVIDVAVLLSLDPPTTSPDTSTASLSNSQARYLPPSTAFEYILFGPDAMWLNSLTAVTRVTVTKEYCK